MFKKIILTVILPLMISPLALGNSELTQSELYLLGLDNPVSIIERLAFVTFIVSIQIALNRKKMLPVIVGFMSYLFISVLISLPLSNSVDLEVKEYKEIAYFDNNNNNNNNNNK